MRGADVANAVLAVPCRADRKRPSPLCATIHSPTPYAFQLFDRVMILLRGNVAYFGENGEGGRFGVISSGSCLLTEEHAFIRTPSAHLAKAWGTLSMPAG